VIVSHSAEQTHALGRRIGRACRGGEVLLLEGTLGMGKTCFAKGVADGLRLNPNDVTSPTFTLMQVHHGRLPFYHVDLYRIEHADEIAHLGLFDEMVGIGVTLIEWPAMGGPHTPVDGICIRISASDKGDDSGDHDHAGTTRHIDLTVQGDGPSHLLDAIG